MRNRRTFASAMTQVLALSVALFVPATAPAHCDGLDGPVVKAAQKALETGNLNLALIWVQMKDEAEITAVFHKTVAVRKLSSEARELADAYFFETLVRIHRAGEGEPFTGLKAAGRDLGPALPAADNAINTGSLGPLLKLFPSSAHLGIRERFDAAISRKGYSKNDVGAGRGYVKAYVEFIHYVEELYGSPEGPLHDEQKGARPIDAHKDAHKDAHALAERRDAKADRVTEIGIPHSLKAEHEELHSELAGAIATGGRVGEAAKEVARLLHPHFVKEEEYAMPALGLLRPLAEGRVTPEMAKAIKMSHMLKAELPEMLKEHKAIVAALETLTNAAKSEGKAQFVRFAEELRLHAQTEEEVLYPASILIGEYLKVR